MVTFLSTGFEGLPPIPVMSTGNCQKTFFYYRVWRVAFNPCNVYRVITGCIPVQWTGISLYWLKTFMFQLQGFPCFSNDFSLFWLHSFCVLLAFFPCLLYRVFPVLLKTQIYRDFPLLVTTFLCSNYRISLL